MFSSCLAVVGFDGATVLSGALITKQFEHGASFWGGGDGRCKQKTWMVLFGDQYSFITSMCVIMCHIKIMHLRGMVTYNSNNPGSCPSRGGLDGGLDCWWPRELSLGTTLYIMMKNSLLAKQIKYILSKRMLTFPKLPTEPYTSDVKHTNVLHNQ